MDEDHSDAEPETKLQNADLPDQAAQIEKLTADLADRDAQIEALNADLNNREGQIEALKADIIRRAGENGTLSAELAAKQEQLLSLQSVFDSQKLQMKQWFIEKIAGSKEDASSGGFTMRFRIRSSDSPNVRSEPGTSGKVVGHASAAAEYEVLDVSPGVWLKIRLENGKTGWISSKMGTLSDLQFSFENAQ